MISWYESKCSLTVNVVNEFLYLILSVLFYFNLLVGEWHNQDVKSAILGVQHIRMINLLTDKIEQVHEYHYR